VVYLFLQPENTIPEEILESWNYQHKSTIKPKKIIGSFLMLLVIAGIFLPAVSTVHARLIATRSIVNIDGTISSKNPNYFVVNSSGTGDVTVYVNNGTRFIPGLSYDAVAVGDKVQVVARSDGSLTAIMVRKISGGTGYGGVPGPQTGGVVTTINGMVSAKTANTFTVAQNSMNVTYTVLSNTHFIGSTFAAMAVGNTVTVVGQDTGTSYVAKTVVVVRFRTLLR